MYLNNGYRLNSQYVRSILSVSTGLTRLLHKVVPTVLWLSQLETRFPFDPPPPLQGHLLGICLFISKMFANAPRWGQLTPTNPHVGGSWKSSNDRPTGQGRNLFFKFYNGSNSHSQINVFLLEPMMSPIAFQHLKLSLPPYRSGSSFCHCTVLGRAINYF